MDLLKSMHIFVSVVDNGSLTAAASKAGISTPMASEHLRYLEMRLGTSLLLRTTRRHTITEFGKFYYRKCLEVLELIDDIENAALENNSEPKGLIRLTAPRSFGNTKLIPKLKEFCDSNPLIELDVQLSDNVFDLVKEGYDAAIRIGELTESNLVARPLLPYDFVICTSSRYLAGRQPPALLEDLKDHDCLTYDYPHWSEWRPQQSQWTVLSQEGEINVKVKARLRVNDALALRMCLLDGMGIAMLPKTLVQDDITAGRLVPLLTHYKMPSRPMHLLYHSGRRVSVRLRLLIDFIQMAFG